MIRNLLPVKAPVLYKDLVGAGARHNHSRHVNARHVALKRLRISRPRAKVAIQSAQRELRAVLDRWETAYRKENFYRGIRILLDLQRDGSSIL